ncbi:endoplasmic reticulum membrane sensor NFE2L1 isoform X1 [Fundulus heteroclitus]|uniref:endoplasmic reticulum membrane sensor NFE2L1 isoform X1 n=1 Tax=Fundulus heteroclitus TaxID=8078 RepID=UPI00165BB7E6|nr:endoplasmic reticulum membrane sensor NFE2L1 isoform X1 [Fundulus heteroclitus]
MQVPQAELETWLVQREPGPLIGGFPDQHSLMDRAPGEIERVQSEPTTEQGAVLGSLEEEERIDVDRSGELECQSSDTEPLVSSVMLPENQPLDLDLELQWQDLMDILEPENTDVEMMTSLNHTPVSRRPATIQGDGFEAPPQNSNIIGNAGTVSRHINLFTGTPLQRDLLGTCDQLDQEPVLLSLTPSDELDDHSLVLNTELALEDSNVDSWVIPSNYSDLQAENPVESFDKGINTEVNLTTLGMNLLTQDFISFGSDFYSCDLKPPSYSQASEGNNLNQDFSITSSSLLVEEDADSFPGQINDLLEDDCNILEDINMLDEALEDGFSPEMAVKLKEEGYLHCEGAHQGTDRGCNSMEAQRLPNTQEDGLVETDSDSGLSLDFIHSPSSSIASEGSADDSSSSVSSCVSTVKNLFSHEEDCSHEADLAGSDLEVEVTIKQEEIKEEEMGAVGGVFPGNGIPLLPANHVDYKQFHGFSWLEHVGHDHTYNNECFYSSTTPAQGRMLSKQTKSAMRRDKGRPYHCSSSSLVSGAKIWNRDEQRARAFRIPFSYEHIVNLPVEEFNDLLTSYQLSKEQLTLIRDIRRRGKNKIAAQNCRKRKQDVLLALEDDLKALRLYQSQLLQEKQKSLRHLQNLKSRFGMLYQEIFSMLMDDNGKPLDAREYKICFGPNGSVTVSSLRANQNNKKRRDVKKRRY